MARDNPLSVFLVLSAMGFITLAMGAVAVFLQPLEGVVHWVASEFVISVVAVTWAAVTARTFVRLQDL